MSTEKSADTATSSSPETSTSSPTPSTKSARCSRQKGRSKKTAPVEEKVPMTFSVSTGFAKKLKMLGGSLDESVSDYVETKLSPIVTRDLKKALEDMS